MADKPYMEFIGSLMYAATMSRPDMSDQIVMLSEHMSDPTVTFTVTKPRYNYFCICKRPQTEVDRTAGRLIEELLELDGRVGVG